MLRTLSAGWKNFARKRGWVTMRTKLPPDLSGNDVHQWLNGGACYGTRGKDLVLGEVVEVESHPDGKTRVYLRDINSGEVWHCTHNECALYWPTFGAVNLNRFAAFVLRASVRQYRRTFNARSMQIDVPEDTAAREKLGKEYRSSVRMPALLRSLEDRTFYTYSDAAAMLRNDKWLSVALSPSVIITATDNIYYRGVHFGKIADGRVVQLGCGPVPKAIHNVLGDLLWY